MADSGKPVEVVPESAEVLMSRVQSGDMGAYQELIGRYQTKVYRVICGYHHDPEDAKEVLQDTFLKIYTSRDTWERRTAFAAWLYRIANNASIDRYRRQDKARKASLEDVMESQIQ